MVKASLAAGLAGLVLFALRFAGVSLSLLVPLAVLGLGAALYLSASMPKFLRVFNGVLAGLEVIFVIMLLADAFGWVSEDLAAYVPPATMVAGGTIFAFLIYGLSRIPVIRTILTIADRYFEFDRDERNRHSVVRSGAGLGGPDRHGAARGAYRHKPLSGGAERSFELFRPRYVQRAAGEGRPRFLVSAVLDLRSAGGDLCIGGAGRDRVAIRSANPLAHVSQRSLCRRVARRRHALPDAARRAGSGQPGPAHRGRPAQLCRPDVYPVDRAAQSIRDARILRRDPVGALAGLHASRAPISPCRACSCGWLSSTRSSAHGSRM